MELFKDAYFSKSGMLVGKELNHCFDCAYCRVHNGELLNYTKYFYIYQCNLTYFK